jgi:thiamine-monophosphate kinase
VRLDVLPYLDALFPAAAPWRVAGMDSSDGLADAVLQICAASQVGAVVERSRLRLPPAFQSWLPPAQAVEWALYGGEDFELVLCLPQAQAQALAAALPDAHIIGEIVAGSEVWLASTDPAIAPQTLLRDRSFQHFATPDSAAASPPADTDA